MKCLYWVLWCFSGPLTVANPVTELLQSPARKCTMRVHKLLWGHYMCPTALAVRLAKMCFLLQTTVSLLQSTITHCERLPCICYRLALKLQEAEES